MIFLGDFWQMPPVGEVALMGDPFAKKALNNAHVSAMLDMFWRPGGNCGLKAWSHGLHVEHLNQNIRSGMDQWFSAVLNHCRLGDLQEDDYNFLHGYPTKAKISFWYEHRKC